MRRSVLHSSGASLKNIRYKVKRRKGALMSSKSEEFLLYGVPG